MKEIVYNNNNISCCIDFFNGNKFTFINLQLTTKPFITSHRLFICSFARRRFREKEKKRNFNNYTKLKDKKKRKNFTTNGPFG